MTFKLQNYKEPDFSLDYFKNLPQAKYVEVEKDGVAPDNYHAMSIYPEYFKVNDKWILCTESRMDTVAVLKDDKIDIVEFRRLKKGDKVFVGRTEDGSEGIYMYTEGFLSNLDENDRFAFRSGRSRETAFSKDYDELYEILKYEKENNGYITWVLGSAVATDDLTRKNFSKLIENGYCHAVLTGNGTAAIDITRGFKDYEYNRYEDFFTKIQNEYKTIREVKELGGIKSAVENNYIENGIFKTLTDFQIPYVLAGSIRDRFNFDETYKNVYEAQDEMRKHTRKSTMLICLSSVLNTIASGNMTPSYNEFDSVVRPIYIYSIDLQEFSVNKLTDRGTLEVKTMVTNVHDFIKNLERRLI
ncbi:MAG: hypothetical protein Q4P29_01355 [Tissierellia bacterium]|nr:hypothetical protein [Tissierellia bacterium]